MGRSDKKELLVRACIARPPLYEVYYTAGGELPEMLQGSFTSKGEAQRRIDYYLTKRVTRKSKLPKSEDLKELNGDK
jgi:hypothetical protein